MLVLFQFISKISRFYFVPYRKNITFCEISHFIIRGFCSHSVWNLTLCSNFWQKQQNIDDVPKCYWPECHIFLCSSLRIPLKCLILTETFKILTYFFEDLNEFKLMAKVTTNKSKIIQTWIRQDVDRAWLVLFRKSFVFVS